MLAGSKGSQKQAECDGKVPCNVCTKNGQECRYGEAGEGKSAWARVKPEAVQRWAETVQLVPGIEGGVRLQPKRDAAGQVKAFERQTMVKRDQDLRLVPTTSKARLCFPATIDAEEEVDEMDLLGDPLKMEADGPLLQTLHDVLPRQPLHPAIYLNASLRDRPSNGSSRILSSYEPSSLILGNVAASAYYRSSEDDIIRSGSVWRRAESSGGRPTAVGWGSFTPLPVKERPRSSKGKERAPDEAGSETSAASPDLQAAASDTLLKTTSPIQQLQLASLSDASQLMLACRSHTSLDLLHLDTSDLASSARAIPATLSHFRYSGAQLNKRPIADFALGGIAAGYGQPGSGLVVDTEGAVFGFGLDQGGSSRVGHPNWSGFQPQMFRLRRKRQKKGAGELSGMVRVGWGGMRGEDAVVALEDEVLLYDSRSPNSSLVLVDEDILTAHPAFHDPSPARVTSLLSRSPSHPALRSAAPPTAIHVVCTTRDVLWLDERMPGPDVMRWKHGRVGIEGKGSDTTLSLLELPPMESCQTAAQVQRFALHSRLHPQVDIFTAELDPTCSPRTLLEPYSIRSPYRVQSVVESPFSQSGLSFVQCADVNWTAVSPSQAKAKKLGAQDGGSSDTEEARPSLGPDGDDFSSAQARTDLARQLSLRMIDVGSAGQVYERDLVLARLAGKIEKESPQQNVVVDLVPKENGAVAGLTNSMNRLRTSFSQSGMADPPTSSRKPVDATVLASILRSELEKHAALPGDETAMADQDRAELAARAEHLYRPGLEEADADIGALTLLEAAALAARSEEDVESNLEALPRPPAAAGAANYSSAAAQLHARLQGVAPATLDLTPRDPPTLFDAMISPFATVATKLQPQSEAVILSAARTILLPRAVEPDEPTLAPNQPQPADQDPPPLHLSYFRPRENESRDDSDDARDVPRGKRPRKRKGPKPSLDAVGPRLLLAEWHIGADPRSYAWHNPYEGEKNKSVYLDASQAGITRKARKKRDGTMSGVSFEFSSQPSSSARPPAFQPSSSFPASSQAYFPSLAPPSTPARPAVSQFEPRIPASSSQDWTQAAATQPAISVTAPLDSPARTAPPCAGAASQVVPGAFGSRLSVAGHGVNVKDKKKGKKRVSGF
ncbi:hypothetical protein JCM10908_004388 [Rhodotorula pacifica]|uniref:uncharacterized protein n=1 Tax=Rhodotorula pacifica TaxID=1495444 RepID=UPI003181AAAE